METFGYVIVKADDAYNNEIEMKGGGTLVVNTTIESVEHINRTVTVVSAPSFTVLEEGDELVIHHNIMRLRNGIDGNVVQSDYYLEDNTYFVPLTEIFMYRKPEGEWKSLAPYCFVEPVKYEVDITVPGVIIPDSAAKEELSYKGQVKQTGIMTYSNEELEEMGVKVGDKIIFSDYSEYEVKVEGKTYYKMSSNDILAVVEE